MGVFVDAARHIDAGIEIFSQKPTEFQLTVDERLVTIEKKPGRTEVKCECTNHGRFWWATCSHKAAGITFTTMRRLV